MLVRLRDNLHFCIIGGRAVFLDIGANRYFCLTHDADRLFMAAVSGTEDGSADDEENYAHLAIRLGLIDENSPAAAGFRTPPEPPTEEIRTHGIGRPRAGLLLTSSFDLVRAAWRRRRHDLTDIQIWLDRQRAGQTPLATAQAAAIATDIKAAFVWCDLLFGRTDRCLPRSLAFVAACNRRGLFPSLVFGVRANPFAAHCWVQHGALVLNDSLERVRIYAPIAML